MAQTTLRQSPNLSPTPPSLQLILKKFFAVYFNGFRTDLLEGLGLCRWAAAGRRAEIEADNQFVLSRHLDITEEGKGLQV